MRNDMNEENKCRCGGNHAWMIGQPRGAHYAVYDSGTWAFTPDRIGFADAIAFAAENGMDVYFHHDTCAEQSDGVVWAFTEHFPEEYVGGGAPEADDNQAKVTLGEVLPNECYDVDQIVIHWSKRPTPPPPQGPRPMGPRRRKK
tara:strand:+ start:147 stop:578 length:432 start_codon:yes stop_codon:yes gene_type:complete